MAEDQSLYNTVDWSSFSNPLEAVSTDIRLEWNLDFDNQTIAGAVEHSVKVLVADAQFVSFDSSNLHIIDDVLINGEIGQYACADKHAALGTKISVIIPDSLRFIGSTFTIRFKYSVDNTATAVQWLPPSATKGGQHPYVFTQSQAIHARSLLPCMDTPGVKTTYSAIVTAPKWCTVLMSALADTTRVVSSSDSLVNTFYWTQPVPTPAYLIALAAGNLASRDISDRVRIWSEPEVVEAAAFEFSETEDFLQAAEVLTNCPYKWSRYDVLCLPPSFPYGGMENPCLTFATPTLLAGDKSLADVIAHEIAHSWTGNLVTNHNWDHFWLNEGWTVWLERKITSKVKGTDETGRLSAQIGYKHLKDDIELMGTDNIFTCALWKLTGQDPDEAFSAVPYEKGFNLLMYLEGIVGREVFEAFAAVYIDTFKFRTVTTGSFRDCFVDFIKKTHAEAKAFAATAQTDKKKNDKKKRRSTAPTPTAPVLTVSDAVLFQVSDLPWMELFCTPGMPKHVPDYSNSLSEKALQLAQHWIAHRDSDDSVAYTSSDMQGWSSQQMQIFLETFANFALPEGTSFSHRFLLQLDEAYHFSASRNAEIMFRWQSLCLRSNMAYIVPFVKDFITSQGRMKFVRPLYRALATSTVGKGLAMQVFQEHKHIYHPICRKMVEVDLIKIGAAQKELDSDDEDESVFHDVPEEAAPEALPVIAAASEHVPAVAVPEPADEPTPEEDAPVPLRVKEVSTIHAAPEVCEQQVRPAASSRIPTSAIPVERQSSSSAVEEIVFAPKPAAQPVEEPAEVPAIPAEPEVVPVPAAFVPAPAPVAAPVSSPVAPTKEVDAIPAVPAAIPAPVVIAPTPAPAPAPAPAVPKKEVEAVPEPVKPVPAPAAVQPAQKLQCPFSGGPSSAPAAAKSEPVSVSTKATTTTSSALTNPVRFYSSPSFWALAGLGVFSIGYFWFLRTHKPAGRR